MDFAHPPGISVSLQRKLYELPTLYPEFVFYCPRRINPIGFGNQFAQPDEAPRTDKILLAQGLVDTHFDQGSGEEWSDREAVLIEVFVQEIDRSPILSKAPGIIQGILVCQLMYELDTVVHCRIRSQIPIWQW